MGKGEPRGPSVTGTLQVLRQDRDAQFPGSEEAANAEELGKGRGFLKIGYFP